MKLRQITGTRPSDSELLEETSNGIAAVSLANKTFGTGKPLVNGIQEAAVFYESPERNTMFRVFKDLRDYAYDDDVAQSSNDDIYHAFAFVLAVSPIAEFFNAIPPLACERVLNAAEARDKLNSELFGREPVLCGPGCVIDYDQDILPSGLATGLTVYELAILSQMKEQSVRNTLQRDSSIPRSFSEDARQTHVPMQAAMEWLKAREGFSWRPPKQKEDELLVPVAKDGSCFSMRCKQPKGFRVGPKGDEKYYETFLEALAALDDMEDAYWRRPSATSGVFGIVKGLRWEPRLRSELGLD